MIVVSCVTLNRGGIGRKPRKRTPAVREWGTAGTSPPILGRRPEGHQAVEHTWWEQNNRLTYASSKRRFCRGLGAISWVNAGIHRVSLLVALTGFKIFNS